MGLPEAGERAAYFGPVLAPLALPPPPPHLLMLRRPPPPEVPCTSQVATIARMLAARLLQIRMTVNGGLCMQLLI